jgi:cell pole-organizing protein PopZ
MAEAAKTHEQSMEELRSRIRRIITEIDDKPTRHRTESATAKSDTPASSPILGMSLAIPPLQQFDPTSYPRPDDQVSAVAISDSSSDPIPGPPATSGLYARDSDSAPLFDPAGKPAPILQAAPAETKPRNDPLLGHASEHVPIPSRVSDAAPAGGEQGDHLGEQGPIQSLGSDAAAGRNEPEQPAGEEAVSDAAPGRQEIGSGQAGQEVATARRGPDSVLASVLARGGRDWDQLISRDTTNAVHSAFDALTQAVVLHNARTLEDMVREMLRPILKVWLDDNLPSIVERLVRIEIERAQRPARSKSGQG